MNAEWQHDTEDERTLMDRIIELATDWLGWHVLHLRPARTAHGWRTPVQGDLGKGWPDLILVRGSRIVAAEVKSERGRLTAEQAEVLGILSVAGVETHVWKPSDWDTMVAVLSR